MGDLHATWSTEGPISAMYPDIQVISIPYLFSSDLVAWDFFDNSQVWKDIIEGLRKEIGLRTLCTSHLGYRHFSNRLREIRTPDDMKGIKIRVMGSPVYTSNFALFYSNLIFKCDTSVCNLYKKSIKNLKVAEEHKVN